MRYDLKNPVRHEGVMLKSIILRLPTADDKTAILSAAAALEAERGRPLTPATEASLLIAQVADLPREAVRKLGAQDAMALSDHVTRLFAERGMP